MGAREFAAVAAEKDFPGGVLLEHQRVVQADGDHESFDLMISVGSLCQHFQVEIHLGRCPDHHVVGEIGEQGHSRTALGRALDRPQRFIARANQRDAFAAVLEVVQQVGEAPFRRIGSRKHDQQAAA